MTYDISKATFPILPKYHSRQLWRLQPQRFHRCVSLLRASSSRASRGGGSNCLYGSRCSLEPGMEFSPPAWSTSLVWCCSYVPATWWLVRMCCSPLSYPFSLCYSEILSITAICAAYCACHHVNITENKHMKKSFDWREKIRELKLEALDFYF